MRKPLKVLLKFAATASACIMLSACATTEPLDADPKELVFAGIPLDGSTEISDSYQLMVDVLSKELDMPISLFEASDPLAIQAAFAAGKVHIASMAAMDYWVQRTLTQDLELLAVSTQGEGLAPGNRSLGFSRVDDASVRTIEDLKGKTACFSERTGGGFLVSGFELAQVGVMPSVSGEDGVRTNFTGGAANSFYALKNKTCDALFTIETTISSVFSKNLDLNRDDYRLIHTSRMVPGSGLILSTKLSSELRKKISEVTLTKLNKKALVLNGFCDDEESCKFLNRSNWGYVKPPKNYYEPVLVFCREIDKSNCPVD